MTSSTPGDDARTEIIHDVDYPLDVPEATGSGAGAGKTDSATTAFPERLNLGLTGNVEYTVAIAGWSGGGAAWNLRIE